MARCPTCSFEVPPGHNELLCPRCGNPMTATGPSRHTLRTTQELEVDGPSAPTKVGPTPVRPDSRPDGAPPPAPPQSAAPVAESGSMPQGRVCPNPACGAPNASDARECAYCFTALAPDAVADVGFVLRFPWGDVAVDHRVRIGRSPEYASAPMPVDSPYLSRRHAEVWVENGHAYVLDLFSHNGTFRNGVRLAATPVEVHDGDQLEFGSAEVRAVVGRRQG